MVFTINNILLNKWRHKWLFQVNLDEIFIHLFTQQNRCSSSWYPLRAAISNFYCWFKIASSEYQRYTWHQMQNFQSISLIKAGTHSKNTCADTKSTSHRDSSSEFLNIRTYPAKKKKKLKFSLSALDKITNVTFRLSLCFCFLENVPHLNHLFTRQLYLYHFWVTRSPETFVLQTCYI